MKREEKELEIARSYISLSGIFATLTGFFVVASGLFIQICLFNLSLYKEENNFKNVMYAGAYANLFWLFLIFSIIFMILTFVYWKKGKNLIKSI